MAAFRLANFSGGASGNFMYYSKDKRFIVKQITYSEFKKLMSMLDGYIAHMEKAAAHGRTEGKVNSLLLRIVQCNRIDMYGVLGELHNRMPNWDGRRMHFIVTENVFYERLMHDAQAWHRSGSHPGMSISDLFDDAEDNLSIYDIKGSFVNRSVLAGLGNENTCGVTMKDNDLREKLYLTAENADHLTEMLRHDTEFLKEHNIMDYSVLLGIRRGLQPTSGGTQLTPQSTAVTQSHPGAYAPSAVFSALSYDFGIIDILQEWNNSKKMERMAKALIPPFADIDGISAIEPSAYRRRFLKKMQRHIERKPPEYVASSSDPRAAELEPEPELCGPE
jgi:hypothetical protein